MSDRQTNHRAVTAEAAMAQLRARRDARSASACGPRPQELAHRSALKTATMPKRGEAEKVEKIASAR